MKSVRTIATAASLLSICFGVSYFVLPCNNLRGSTDDHLTKADEISEEDLFAAQKSNYGVSDDYGAHSDQEPFDNEDNIDEDQLQAYNLSPFEKHWPGYHIDPWMYKAVTWYPPKDKEVCLVHVGKSAGYTVACALGFPSPGCPEEKETLGVLPKYTTKWFHAGLYDCFDDSAFYFFVVRNPLDRAVSAFNYGKPTTWESARKKSQVYYERLKALYLDCFDTIEQLAADGLAANGNATATCRLRASQAIEGSAHFENHLYFNYQYHLEAVPKDARIITIRTEHLIDDWNTAEFTVGGDKNVFGEDQTLIPRINVNDSTDKEKYLSDESRVLICEKLCNEIQVYKQILKVSVNLIEEQIQESISELKLSCPIEAEAQSCGIPLPDITEKLLGKRGYDEGTLLSDFTGNISVGRTLH
ncbi:hypothetical protein HJC23_002495 [Cyclotella cryptica]|uniref:Sulfotransferase n=1 Tax=Cyclotella cryptica TaxID=29204 RepID=A0ABD3P9B5_9STRA|eukprot:CCRYP_016659-RA/>CCRYP_016659-RA protein AED:0.13 eAED:0.13 QI:93/1/1/1/1/1/2/358/414